MCNEKYVFDTSDVASRDIIIQDESGLGCHSYIQFAPALEHLSYPLALIRKSASFLRFRCQVKRSLVTEARFSSK
jgi:hypothetical protein